MYGITPPKQNTQEMRYFEKTPPYIIIREKPDFSNFFLIIIKKVYVANENLFRYTDIIHLHADPD